MSRFRVVSLLRRRALGTGVVAATAVLAVGALAFFAATGSGSGSATAATTQPVTLSPATPSTQLYPGGQADVALTISNPNPTRIHVGSLSLNTTQGTGGFAADSNHSGCSVSALTYTAQNAGWTVPPKVGSTNGTLSIDLPKALSMSTGAASGCQGAAFTVYLTPGS